MLSFPSATTTQRASCSWTGLITGQRWRARLLIGRPSLPTSCSIWRSGWWRRRRRPGRSGLLQVNPLRLVTPMNRRAAANDQTSRAADVCALLRLKDSDCSMKDRKFQFFGLKTRKTAVQTRGADLSIRDGILFHICW